MRSSLKVKPPYEELERRVQELEKIESEHKHSKEALREKSQLLQDIIDTTSDLVSVADMTGNFKFLGPSFTTLGYEPDALVGRNVMELVHPDDYQDVAAAFAEFLASREDGRKAEYRYRRADGNYLWLETVGKFIVDDAGKPKEILFTSRDFTARRHAEGELKRLEWMLSKKPGAPATAQTVPHDQGYGDLTELNRDGIILKAIGHQRLKSFANDYLELLGTSSAIYEVNGDYAFGIFASGWCRMMDSASRKLCNTSDNVAALKSGRWLCHESCWTDCSKAAIARRSQVDIECHGGIRLYATPIFAGGDVIGAINFGYGDPPKDPEKLKMLADAYHLNLEDLLREATTYDSRPPYIIEMAKKRLNSTAKLIGSMVEAMQALEALRESENQISSIFRSAPIGIGSVVNRVLSKVNSRLCKMTGYDEAELIGQSSRMLYPSAEDFECAGREKYAQIADRGTGMVETRWQKRDGTIIDVLLSSTPVNLEDHAKGVTFTALDITDRKQAEKDLHLAHERILTILDGIDSTVYVADMESHEILFMNQKMITDFGGNKTGDLCYRAFRKNAEPCACCTNEQLIDNDGNPAGVCVWHDHNPVTGRYYINLDRAIAWTDGRLVRMQIATDITELKKMEAQLHQAQKMESVGRLAGGIAHDFNNMLGIILGHTEMALEEIDPATPLHASLLAVQHAAERSAALTRQLLAFARKQTIAPKVIDINDTVEGMLKMLRRLIGEDIDLLWQPGRNLKPVKVDPSQIDQLLANLCVNARDAIAGVGKVTIETEAKTLDEAYCADHLGFLPGEYVLLEVSDNGCGMDPKTLTQIFEPFFTTKEQGKGTGLGLASVFGMVKQNNGFINVYSEPGQGTTFKIYLPAYTVKSAGVVENAPALPAKRGNETILLVEDEPAILQMTTMMLTRLGYTVVAAATPGEAIRLALEYRGRIDLLMTDVVMPEMNGRELAGNLLSHFPDLKRLFMSGYTANVIAHHGVLDDGVHFIQKPFSIKDLGGKLRETLDG
jgi:PAS domain S-box-containing protein